MQPPPRGLERLTASNHMSGDHASLRTLFFGDSSSPEFKSAARLLAESTALSIVADAAACEQRLRDEPGGDLLVVAQSHPGCVSANHWRAWRAAAPTTPALLLTGTWSEGERRTGRPLAGALRISWHEWPAFFALQLARIERGERPLWAAPATLSDGDQLLERGPLPATPAGHVAVLSPNRAMSDLLRDVFGRQGWHVALPSPHVDSPSVDADLILWDATEQPDASIERFARFRPHKSAPVIVLADFPRPDEIERWRQHGAAQVLAKPFYLDELLTMATALV